MLKRDIIILPLFIGFGVFILLQFCDFSEKLDKHSKILNLYSTKYTGDLRVFWNWNDTVNYMGAETCIECHPDEYRLFMQSGMGKSFDFAKREKSSAIFDETAVVYDSANDFYYKPYWENGSLKVLEFRLEGNDTVFKHVEDVIYIVGSGHHTNSHIYSVNGYLYQVPITFYIQKKFWSIAPGFEAGYSSRYGRKIGLECISCHNDYPKMIMGSENKYTSIPQGISCERCHGPCELHNKYMAAGKVINQSKYTDSTVVTPGKLPVELLFDLCARCHLQGNTVLIEGKSFYDFLPGMRLSDVMVTFLPQFTEEVGFLMANHSARMVMSKCFTESNKNPDINKQLKPYKHPDAFTCLTCHTPHTSVFSEKKNHFISACLKCHNLKQKSFCTVSYDELKKNNFNCISCHMPTVPSIDIPNITITDHFIRIPEKQNSEFRIQKPEAQSQYFVKLYCTYEPEPDNKTLARAYLYQYEKFETKPFLLDSAKKYLSDNTYDDIKNNFHLLISWAYLQKDYKKLLQYISIYSKEELLNKILVNRSWDNEDAWTSARIGDAFFHLGKYRDAYDFYEKATELAPFIPEIFNKLGSVCVNLNKISEAKAIFEYIVNENPKFILALSNLGYIYQLSGDLKTAEIYYNKALSLDCDYEMALFNKINLYIQQGKYAEAKEILLKILKRDPKNVTANKILKHLMDLP